MKGLAAPGPDGLPALFYHTYWDIIGQDVTRAALQILNNNEDTTPYNNTHICLIPKKPNPDHPSDFRPISLCNVILKIITKTIANILKTILPNVISPNQSAFVPGRLITDNTLLAYEIFHYFNQSTSKQGFIGIKTDMAKAYDRVEWNFLQATMETMGFPSHLTNIIMNCVTNVTFSILINGQPSQTFKPQRGLRQGDPLSPYLFILCVNVFSGLITKAQVEKKLHGVKVANGAPEISHLLFADDSLLLCRATPQEAMVIKEVIHDYQEASGQLVNMAKSEICFSKHVPTSTKEDINHILPMNRVDHFSKYLGMLTHVGRSKKQVFNYIQDNVWKKIKGWKAKNLSFAGRSTLIKAVAQAVPTYVMSCFLLPKDLCSQLESMICRFWWGSNNDRRKIHWIKNLQS
jgi:hypothetical protein